MAPKEDTFKSIFDENLWGSDESRSGRGSEMEYTIAIRMFLSQFIKNASITSILDAPCGDCNWQMEIEGIENVHYTGVDIVEELIEQNRKKVSNPNARFSVADISKDSIGEIYDLVIVRDCLQHIPVESALNVIKNVLESRSVFLMTNFHICNNLGQGNTGTHQGGFYRINVMSEPFNFPPPLTFFAEHAAIPGETKAMGLWEISDLIKTLKFN